jgi:hypothetical protein
MDQPGCERGGDFNADVEASQKKTSSDFTRTRVEYDLDVNCDKGED